MKRNIPNLLTCCNLIAGCSATFMAFNARYELALLLIVTGAVFDFFDGFAARLLKVGSPIGKELDSLADIVTFGVAPAAMLFSVLGAGSCPLNNCCPYLPYTAFVMVAFSALRLAKYNLDERQAMGFIGLPTPANALFWASLIVGTAGELPTNIVLVGVFLSSYLLTCELPMFALKFKTFAWKDNALRYSFMLGALLLVLFFHIQGIAAAIVFYILISVVAHWWTKKGKQ